MKPDVKIDPRADDPSRYESSYKRVNPQKYDRPRKCSKHGCDQVWRRDSGSTVTVPYCRMCAAERTARRMQLRQEAPHRVEPMVRKVA